MTADQQAEILRQAEIARTQFMRDQTKRLIAAIVALFKPKGAVRTA